MTLLLDSTLRSSALGLGSRLSPLALSLPKVKFTQLLPPRACNMAGVKALPNTSRERCLTSGVSFH